MTQTRFQLNRLQCSSPVTFITTCSALRTGMILASYAAPSWKRKLIVIL